MENSNDCIYQFDNFQLVSEKVVEYHSDTKSVDLKRVPSFNSIPSLNYGGKGSRNYWDRGDILKNGGTMSSFCINYSTATDGGLIKENIQKLSK